jgi:transposase-like protein
MVVTPESLVERKPGNRTKYSKELLKYIKPIMINGGSVAEVCAKFEISKQCHSRWLKNHEEYALEMGIGQQLSEAWWANKGKQSLESKDFQYGNYSFNMRNRFGWRIKEDTGPSITINADNKSAEDVVEHARAIADKIRRKKD